MEQTFHHPLQTEYEAADRAPLTTTEIAALWNTYMQYTMFTCIFKHFSRIAEDHRIRLIMEETLDIVSQRVSRVMEILNRENLPLPVGFTDQDLDLNAPRLYSDPFFLYYLRDMNKFAIAINGLALTTSARADIRGFYSHCVSSTMKLYSDATDTLLARGLFIRPPCVAIAREVDYVKRQSFLAGFLGGPRPLLAQEISALAYGIMTNNVVKRLLLGFRQTARSGRVRKHLEQGISLANKFMDTFNAALKQEEIPGPVTWDAMVTDSTVPPFSDKLMLFKTNYVSTAFLISYATFFATSLRHDLSAAFARAFTEVAGYARDGIKIMIDSGWYEEPPRAVDRDELINRPS
ncbi:MAG: DUF3231 family protein [Syntrophomonadaceae bacterium]|nr:DUF3231 family protein [Syntrophomonadaceae bacterium]